MAFTAVEAEMLSKYCITNFGIIQNRSQVMKFYVSERDLHFESLNYDLRQHLVFIYR
jgi:hypothetical protein